MRSQQRGDYRLGFNISQIILFLSRQPRITRVLYVCYAHGKNEIYSLKETSSCNYEIIVLTPNLCLHPKYKIQETKDNAINCVPLENAPKKPKSLLAMEVESMKNRYQKLMVRNFAELCLRVFVAVLLL